MEMLENKSIALPTTSATSSVLLKILMSHLNVNYEVKPPEIGSMLTNSDAALLIGDDALRVEATGIGCQVSGVDNVPRIRETDDLFLYDMAELWQRKTGFPIVFAVWAVRKDYARQYPEVINDIAHSLRKSLDYGLANIDKIIDRVLTEFPGVDLRDYFRRLKYEFGAKEREGLLAYYDYAVRLGLCERCEELATCAIKI